MNSWSPPESSQGTRIRPLQSSSGPSRSPATWPVPCAVPRDGSVGSAPGTLGASQKSCWASCSPKVLVKRKQCWHSLVKPRGKRKPPWKSVAPCPKKINAWTCSHWNVHVRLFYVVAACHIVLFPCKSQKQHKFGCLIAPEKCGCLITKKKWR